MSGATGAGRRVRPVPTYGQDGGAWLRRAATDAQQGQGRAVRRSAHDNLQAIKPRTTGKRSPDTDPGIPGGNRDGRRGPQTQQYRRGSATREPASRWRAAASAPRHRRCPASGSRSSPRGPTTRRRPTRPLRRYAGGGTGGPRRGGADGARVPGRARLPRTRKARLRVAKADPWSVMKVSFLLSIALGICTIVAAAVLWMVMDAMGVFSTVGGTISRGHRLERVATASTCSRSCRCRAS